MNGKDTELCYRRVAVEQATSAGLCVILYDMLVGELRHAIVAMREGDIEERSRRLKHAFSILEVMDGSVDLQREGPAAKSLSQFYGFLRNRLLAAQFDSDDQMLEDQIRLILDVREAWRQADKDTLLRSHDSNESTAMPRSSLIETEVTATSQWIA